MKNIGFLINKIMMKKLKIKGTSSYLPNKIIENAYFEDILDTNDEWITSRTGIRQRRFVEKETNAFMATKTASELIAKYNLQKEDIAAVIVSNSTPDNTMPSIAAEVKQNLMFNDNIICFDFNVACSGFVYGLHIAKGLLLQQPSKKIILISTETMSNYVNFKDRSTCILFGDGAGGVLLGLSDDGEDFFDFGTTTGSEKLVCNQTDKLQMNGKEVFNFAVKQIVMSIEKVLLESNKTIEEIDYFICHQANYRILQTVSRKIKVDIEKFYSNIEKYGNTSSASIPIILDEMNNKNLLKEGKNIIITGFGAGLSWGTSLITW